MLKIGFNRGLVEWTPEYVFYIEVCLLSCLQREMMNKYNLIILTGFGGTLRNIMINV